MASGIVQSIGSPTIWHRGALGGTGNTSLRVTNIPWDDVAFLFGFIRPGNTDSYAFIGCRNAGGYFMRTGYVTTSGGKIAFSVSEAWGFVEFIYALKSENPHLT